jgi:tight adherence protein C
MLNLLLCPALVGAEPPTILETESQVDAFPQVVLQFAVEDQRRQAVKGLLADQITIIEGGQEITPLSVAMVKDSPEPVALMIALDTSVAMNDGGRFDQAREGIKSVAARLRPTDSIGLVRFDNTFGLAQPFTRDRVVLGQVLDRLVADGNRKLYDGAYLALSETAHVAGNRAVVLITSGDDSQSVVSLGTLKNWATDVRLKIYVVGVGSGLRDELLESLAKGSGGRYYRAPNATDLPTVLRAVHTDFTSRYEVVYTSPEVEATAGERVVARLVVTAPDGAGVAAIAYQVPRTRAAPLSPNPRRQVPLQALPPRPAPTPIPDNVIVAGGLLTSLGILLSAIGYALHETRTRRTNRLRAFLSTATVYEVDQAPSLMRLASALVVRLLASTLIRILPPHQVRRASHRLILAGSPYNWRVSHFVALKGVLAIGGVLIGWLVPPASLLMAVALPVLIGLIGFMLPELWLSNRVSARQREILRSLPNALDLLAISVEAGLSLDAAMLEVVHKWNNALSEEFSTVLTDIKVGRTRREALRGMAQRTDMTEVTAFASALIQADEVGLSIGRTLAVQAEQIRLRRRQRAERLAREASIKMLFPMALLIFPALFVVILVPAIPTMMEALRALGG